MRNYYSGIPSASRWAEPDLLIRLRELVGFFEWSEPPRLDAADALQAIADQYQRSGMSDEAAEAVLNAWEPFAGVEAAVGNMPPTMIVADDPGEMRKGIIAQLRELISGEVTPARKILLSRLLKEQVRIFREARR